MEEANKLKLFLIPRR